MKKKISIILIIILIIAILVVCYISNNILTTYNEIEICIRTLNDNGKITKITNDNDIILLKNILADLKYNDEACQLEVDYVITCNNKTYYIKKGCKGVQKGKKQAKIEEEDLNMIIQIIENNSYTRL